MYNQTIKQMAGPNDFIPATMKGGLIDAAVDYFTEFHKEKYEEMKKANRHLVAFSGYQTTVVDGKRVQFFRSDDDKIPLHGTFAGGKFDSTDMAYIHALSLHAAFTQETSAAAGDAATEKSIAAAKYYPIDHAQDEPCVVATDAAGTVAYFAPGEVIPAGYTAVGVANVSKLSEYFRGLSNGCIELNVNNVNFLRKDYPLLNFTEAMSNKGVMQLHKPLIIEPNHEIECNLQLDKLPGMKSDSDYMTNISAQAVVVRLGFHGFSFGRA